MRLFVESSATCFSISRPCALPSPTCTTLTTSATCSTPGARLAASQQGDPLEMIVFCLSVHHLWGRTLNKHHQDACAVAYADDSYIKAKLSVALEVLSDIKHYSRRTRALTSTSTRPRFSSRFSSFSSRRLMRTLPNSACLQPTPPSRTSVPCFLPHPL